MNVVICAILVVAKLDGMSIMDKADVAGKVIGTSESKYVVDFSSEASVKGYIGDYSRKIVNKSDCVILK